MAERIYNFSAGPAVLPESVIKAAQRDVWNIADSGIGIMEHSHRGKVFDRVLEEAEADCRTICDMPDNYRVLFLQGGASLQFTMIAANFLGDGQTADYLNTGVWTKKAIKEAKFYGDVNIAATSEDDNFSYIPDGVIPALREAGVSEEQIATMTVDNPRRIFERQGGY